MATKNYYKILQVDAEAEPEVIKAAYTRLARKYHPDVNTSPDATLRMQEINEAYEVLGDPIKREQYDNQRVKTEYVQRPPRAERPPEPPPPPPQKNTYTSSRQKTRQQQADAEQERKRRFEEAQRYRAEQLQREQAEQARRVREERQFRSKQQVTMTLAMVVGIAVAIGALVYWNQYQAQSQNSLVSGGFTQATGTGANFNLTSSGPFTIRLVNNAWATKYAAVIASLRFADGSVCNGIANSGSFYTAFELSPNSVVQNDVQIGLCAGTNKDVDMQVSIESCQIIVAGVPISAQYVYGQTETLDRYRISRDYTFQSESLTLDEVRQQDWATFIPCSLPQTN